MSSKKKKKEKKIKPIPQPVLKRTNSESISNILAKLKLEDGRAEYMTGCFLEFAEKKKPKKPEEWVNVLKAAYLETMGGKPSAVDIKALESLVTELDAAGLIDVEKPLMAFDRNKKVIEVKAQCSAVLEEDKEWHEAVVEEILEEGRIRIIFPEFGKPQVVPGPSVVLMAEYEDAGEGDCRMCEREMPLTRHHLIPRTVHPRYFKMGISREVLNTTVDICRPCHDACHRFADESTLAEKYNTLELLLAQEEIRSFIRYVQKQRIIKKQDAAKYLPKRR